MAEGRKAKPWKKALLCGCLLAVALVGFWGWRCYKALRHQTSSDATRINLTISPETTYLLGPVKADGTIDYFEAVKNNLAEGVTPENNAAVPLLKIIGPRMFNSNGLKAALKELGVESLPEGGDYFISLWNFAPIGSDGKVTNPTSADGSPLYIHWGGYCKDLSEAGSAPWVAQNFPAIDLWLRAGAKHLDAVREASLRPRLYLPDGGPRARFQVLPRASWTRNVSEALCARAMLSAGQGDVDSACADLMAVHRLARLAAQGKTAYACRLSAENERMALVAEQGLAASGRLTANQAVGLREAIEQLPDVPTTVAWWADTERVAQLDAVMFLARGSLHGWNRLRDDLADVLMEWPDYGGDCVEMPRALAETIGDPAVVIDWDMLLKGVNERFDRQVAALAKPTYAQRRPALQELRDEDWAAVKRCRERTTNDSLSRVRRTIQASYGLKNMQVTQALADSMQDCFWSDVDRVGDLQTGVSMRRRVVALALACVAYKAEKGKFPAKLDDLVPGYVKEIPEDFFSGKPLVYKVNDDGKGYVLYSVGPNMKDDGGADETEKRGADDVGIKVKDDKRE
jgi:hypothetical protein